MAYDSSNDDSMTAGGQPYEDEPNAANYPHDPEFAARSRFGEFEQGSESEMMLSVWEMQHWRTMHCRLQCLRAMRRAPAAVTVGRRSKMF